MRIPVGCYCCGGRNDQLGTSHTPGLIRPLHAWRSRRQQDKSRASDGGHADITGLGAGLAPPLPPTAYYWHWVTASDRGRSTCVAPSPYGPLEACASART